MIPLIDEDPQAAKRLFLRAADIEFERNQIEWEFNIAALRFSINACSNCFFCASVICLPPPTKAYHKVFQHQE